MKYYKCPKKIVYFSPRFKKTLTVPVGYASDGATGAIDIYTDAWFVHDWACGSWEGVGPKPTGRWDDGMPITVYQESCLLHDILQEEERDVRAKVWGISTFLFRSFKSIFKKKVYG